MSLSSITLVPETIERLLTVRDVADILNVKTKWIYEHVESGLLPRLRRSRAIRLSPRELALWLDDQFHGESCGVSHDGEPLMTVDELQSYLGFGRSWIHEARRSRGLPYYKLDGLVRFSRPMVDAWLMDIA